MSVAALFVAPLVIWLYRAEIVNLFADCIAEGIKRSRGA